MSAMRLASLGGGHGLFATLRAGRALGAEITAIVTVADDGGSSGRLRSELGIIPPGDLRMALAALMPDDDRGEFWAGILQHRFGGGGAMAGHPVGNLLLAGLCEVLGDPVDALDAIADRLMPVKRTDRPGACSPTSPGWNRPTRWISHSSVTPECAFTVSRTSSPSASISADVAAPRLSRKLQCFSDTCASPRVKPRQPAASISAQALCPAGFLKVDPPVLFRSGCDASRSAAIRSISAPIAAGSAGCPRNVADTTTAPSGSRLWR